jgi:hypothetical protein
MRRISTGLAVVLVVGLALAAPASATETASRVGKFTMTAKITSVRAASGGLVAKGVVVGKLRAGGTVVRDSAPAKFRVAQTSQSGSCNILALRLAPVHLALLGIRVDTSHISLDVTARKRGGVLGRLFCALANAEIRFPRVAVAKLNRHLDSAPIVTRSSAPVRVATHQGTCEILDLILGPLHLDLLGLVVDLYGQTKSDPVHVSITGEPGHGLLGDLLCSLAGGSNITSLSQLQSLLQSLGLGLTDTQLQNLLNQLGIGDLAAGLSQLDVQHILAALGLGTGSITSVTQLQSFLQSLGVTLTEAQVQSVLTQLGIGDLSGGLSQLDLQRVLAQLGLGSSTPPA